MAVCNSEVDRSRSSARFRNRASFSLNWFSKSRSCISQNLPCAPANSVIWQPAGDCVCWRTARLITASRAYGLNKTCHARFVIVRNGVYQALKDYGSYLGAQDLSGMDLRASILYQRDHAQVYALSNSRSDGESVARKSALVPGVPTEEAESFPVSHPLCWNAWWNCVRVPRQSAFRLDVRDSARNGQWEDQPFYKPFEFSGSCDAVSWHSACSSKERGRWLIHSEQVTHSFTY